MAFAGSRAAFYGKEHRLWPTTRIGSPCWTGSASGDASRRPLETWHLLDAEVGLPRDLLAGQLLGCCHNQQVQKGCVCRARCWHDQPYRRVLSGSSARTHSCGTGQVLCPD